MIEKIEVAMEAAALAEAVKLGGARNLTLAMAVAAVKAMREPSEEMIQAAIWSLDRAKEKDGKLQDPPPVQAGREAHHPLSRNDRRHSLRRRPLWWVIEPKLLKETKHA